jgi:hypothetical protein
MKILLGMPDTVLKTSYLPWLDAVDALIGKAARIDLARHTSFIAAWNEGLSPHEAVGEAIEAEFRLIAQQSEPS